MIPVTDPRRSIRWARWREAVRPVLLRRQAPDGSWDGDPGRTALAALVLELIEGYEPAVRPR